MNLVIPENLKKRVRTRARKAGVGEDVYIRQAIERALATDADLDKEMSMWDQVSLQDFTTFTKKHRA